MTTINPPVWPAITLADKKSGDKFMIEDSVVMLAEPYSMASILPNAGSAFVVDMDTGKLYPLSKCTRVEDKKVAVALGNLRKGSLFYPVDKEGKLHIVTEAATEDGLMYAVRLEDLLPYTTFATARVYPVKSITPNME